jgi:hypothetical protein
VITTYLHALRVDYDLAENFLLTDGSHTIVVPEVAQGTNYFVIRKSLSFGLACSRFNT